jgi:hypothetical protein
MALVTTTKGEMDESLLEKREGSLDNDNEHTTWVEYWLDGELVQGVLPAAHVGRRPIAVDAANGDRAVLARLGQDLADQGRLGIVAVDEKGHPFQFGLSVSFDHGLTSGLSSFYMLKAPPHKREYLQARGASI